MRSFIVSRKRVSGYRWVRSVAFLLFLLVFLPTLAQSPEGISYQAVVRDNAGKPLPDTKVNMRFSILQGSADGTAVYTETQALTTNSLGLVTAGIGQGTVVSGDFATIDWSAGPYFLKVEADPSGGSDYSLTGTLQILSVPYALYAKKAGNVFSGDYNDLANAPVNVSAFVNDAGYLTSETDGDTTNELQELSISHDTLFLSNGGSVVLPPDQDSDPTNELQALSISDDTLSLSNGGSVVLPPDEDFQKAGHFVTTFDSVGIYTRSPHSALDVHGRISQTVLNNSVVIGEGAGLNLIKSGTYYNVLIGSEAGKYLRGGIYNVILGYYAMGNGTNGNNNTAVGAYSLYNNKGGDDNIAIGSSSLNRNITGEKNTAVGSGAAFSNTTGTFNSAFGYQSLFRDSSGMNNTATGALALFSNSHGSNNTANGYRALYSNTIGHENTAVGAQSMYANTTGNYNTALGNEALKSNSTAYANTAVGYQSLYATTSGGWNTATGYRSLYSNTTGVFNTAMGYRALASNGTGNSNTATGYYALGLNTTGHDNTATGNWALYFNSTGYNNTAVGSYALYKNEGNNNTAVGDSALYNNSGGQNTAMGKSTLASNTTGFNNTAIGNAALNHNISAVYNVAIGDGAMYAYGDLTYYAGFNTAVGRGALAWLKTGSDNTAIGYFAGLDAETDISNSTALGCCVSITASNQVRIGDEFVTSIGGYAGWSNLSDGRFKTEVKSSVPGLAFILKLRPVMYRLDVDKLNSFLQRPTDLSERKNPQAAQMVRTGFIAQEVEKAAQETGYDFSGIDPPKNEHDYYSLRYAEFVVPLVKAVQEQQAEIEALKEQNRLLQQQIDELKNQANE